MWHPVKQNSEEPCPCCGKNWMDLRMGKVTGSSMAKIMAHYGKAFGDPAKRLAVDVAAVELGGTIDSDGFSNGHTERGHEQEPIARQLYEDTYFTDVTIGGFFDNGLTGCSPDGLVSEDGLIEIKSVINAQHYACISRGSYDPAYKWQVIFNLKETKRDWIDFVSFCATFPAAKRIYASRVYADQVQKEFKMIETRLSEFREMVESIKADIRKAA